MYLKERCNNKSRRVHNILCNLLTHLQEQVQDFTQAFMRLNMLTLRRSSLSFYFLQDRRNGFQSGGTMEH